MPNKTNNRPDNNCWESQPVIKDVYYSHKTFSVARSLDHKQEPDKEKQAVVDKQPKIEWVNTEVELFPTGDEIKVEDEVRNDKEEVVNVEFGPLHLLRYRLLQIENFLVKVILKKNISVCK